MSNTITGTVTVGVTLAANPTIIDGTIATGGGDAIYGGAAQTWTVANNGDVDGGLGVGIDIHGSARIINAAHAYIYGDAYGRNGGIQVYGAATIDNAGGIYTYSQYSYGIYRPSAAIFLAGGGAVTNHVGGVIYGNYAGIVADGNGHFSLLNRGVIAGYQSYGIAAAGTITNARSGTITGRNGIILTGGTLNNAGLIEGGTGFAIYLHGQADEEIIERKTGTLIGGIDGFVGGDTIDEAGIEITSVAFAHDTLTLFDGTARLGTLSLSGDFNKHEFILKSDGHGGTDIELGAETFTGTYKVGVRLSALSSTVAAQARIDGITDGYGRNFTLVNNGNIIATGNYDAGVKFSNGGQITNTGLIEGETGIDDNGGTITNSGTIEGKFGIEAESGTIVNSGTIDGSEGIAIYLFNANNTDIILKPGSVLKGGIAGFITGDMIDLTNITATGETFANGILSITNAGKVVDTIAFEGDLNTSAFKLAAAKGGGTDITIAPAETFTGDYGSKLVLSSLFTSITSNASFASGLDAYGIRDWTVVNAGTLSGAYQGLYPQNGVYLQAGDFINTRTGTIIGAIGVYLVQNSSFNASLSNAGTIIGAGYFDGVGVSVLGNDFVSNLASGSISGSYDGVIIRGGSFLNAGQISGPTGVAVEYGSNLYNAGRIEGLAGAAYAASTGIIMYSGGGNVTNAAQGIISGYIGVQLKPRDTLTDAGTIAATLNTAGAAIDFSGIGATLVLDRGNVIEGAIDGFQSGDIIDFAATTITNDSFSNNILTLLDGAETIETLTLAGTYSQGEFSLVSDGSLGTELVLNALDAAPAMHFLRPGWGDAVIEGVFAHATAPPQAKAAVPNATPSVSGWLPLHQTQPTPIPAVTLQHG